MSSYSQNKPWTIFSSSTKDAFGIGINQDSNYVYSCVSLLSFPYATSFYKVNKTLGTRDSVIIAAVGDSLSFSSFYIIQDDSTITLLGTMFNENEINFGKAQTSAIIKFTKDLVFLDSLVFTENFYATVRYSESFKKYFVTRTIPGAGGFTLTIVNKSPLVIDTTLSFLGSPGYDYDFSVAFDSSANKIVCISTVAQTYIFDAATYAIDTSFWNWDTAYPTIPAIKDMFYWHGTLYSLARPNGISLYRHNPLDYLINKRIPLTLNDTVAGSGGYEYIRGNYGFSNDLLVFAEAGPFTNVPPLQTNTVTNVRAYAADTTGALIWQTQINNGRNNLVHSTACDDSNTFILVRSISVDRPTEPQKMLVYKLDANGNVFDLNTPDEVLKLGVHIYPNPAKGWVIFEMHAGSGNDDFKLQLYNQQGQRVYNNSLAYGKVTLDLKHLAKGIYLYEVSKNGVPQKKGRLVLN